MPTARDCTSGRRLTLPGTTLSTGAELALALAVELVSVCLAGPAGAPAGLDPRPVPSVALTVDVRGDFVVDVGPIGILADAARIGVRWDAVTGLEPHVAVDGGRLVLDGTIAPLPMPVWDADERRLRFVGDIPWDVLERLVAQLLESLANEAAQLLPSLLGWRSTGAGGVPAIPPPLGVPAVPAAMLGLGDLVRDPVRALGRMLVSLLTGPQGREWAHALLGWVTAFTQGLSDSLAVTGIGSTTEPWAVPLVGAGRQVELVVSGRCGRWRTRRCGEPAGAARAAGGRRRRRRHRGHRRRARRGDHRAGADRPAGRRGDPAVGRPRHVARCAAVGRGRHGRPGAGGGATRRRDRGGRADRRRQPRAAGGVRRCPPAGRRSGRGRADLRADSDRRHHCAWPGESASRTLDLTASGLPAESFDLGTLPTTGPWFVVLPTRLGTGAGDVAAGHAEQSARLRRAVDALRAAGLRTARSPSSPPGRPDTSLEPWPPSPDPASPTSRCSAPRWPRRPRRGSMR